jgi:hypothetical protein
MPNKLSKYRYLQVAAHKPAEYEYRNVLLPDDWDAMTDDERERYVKKECFEYWQCAREDDMNIAKDDRRWWHHATANSMGGWEVNGTPLADVVTQPKAWLILKDLYARNSDAYWNEEADEEE